MAIDYSKSIMEIVEKHLSPTPTYVDKRQTFGRVGMSEDGETERVVGKVCGEVCKAIAAELPKPFAGGIQRKAGFRATTKRNGK